jgi:AraC family L-rhamnose operon regulatory protein RhaS
MKPTYQRRPIEVTLSSHGVFVLESHHAPGFRMADQCHVFLEIFYVLKGAGTFHLDGRPHVCHKGDLVVVPVGGVHRIEDDPAAPLALYGICVAPQVWRHDPALLEHLPAGRLHVGKLLAAQLRADLRRMLFEQTLDRPGSRTLVLGLALQLLALLAQSRPGPAPARPAQAAQAASEVAQHRQAVERYVADLPHRFYEATDLDTVAAELHMSRRRFTSLFRLVAGASWSACLTRLRIDYACQLLRETSRGIIAIAFECGYEDLSSFYRAFKRRTGLPPHAWRTRQVSGQRSANRPQGTGKEASPRVTTRGP